jgi:2-dehydropantoate 2-reductase
MTDTDWPRIAVVGAGAVGSYFGGLLARAGAPVVLIGRKPMVEAVRSDGLVIETSGSQFRIEVDATTDVAAVRDASLVLFCVKSQDTESAARDIGPFFDRDNARLLCLQNGVDNVDRIRATGGIEALPAAVYVGVSVSAPGRIKHVGRGDLTLPKSEETKPLSETFQRAGIPCRVSDNIVGEMWVKLLCNAALNAISALGRIRYGAIAADPDARNLMRQVVDEVRNVAGAADVAMPNIDSSDAGMAAALQIATQMESAFSSTAQDLQRGRRTEIDSLNGYVARRGAELGVSTSVNYALYALVKLSEKADGGLSEIRV